MDQIRRPKRDENKGSQRSRVPCRPTEQLNLLVKNAAFRDQRGRTEMREDPGRWIEGGHLSDRAERPGAEISAVASPPRKLLFPTNKQQSRRAHMQ